MESTADPARWTSNAPAVTGLHPLLEARSVAIIGASPRVGSVGNHVVRQLVRGGFAGAVHPVNPRHAEVEGLACAPTVADVGHAVDLAVVAVGDDLLEEQMAAAITAGARSVSIFSSCHGTASDGTPLTSRLGAMARTAGIPVCGGNGMGFLNVEASLRVCGFYHPWDLQPGGITFLSHSGSLFSAMLHNHRGLRFNLAVSTGNEMATTMDAYLAHAVALPSTKAVGLLLETVRNPAGLAAALEMADKADIPVVALKVGRTARSVAAVATHTAALAGDHGAFEAFAARHGVHLVDTMDEMADTLQLFCTGRRAAPGGLGAVHDSGGERSLLIDTAERTRVPLPPVSGATRAALAEALDAGLEPENPVDAWGTGHGATDIFARSLAALTADDGLGVIALCVDLTAEEVPEDSYVRIVTEAAGATDKPLAVITNLAGSVDPGDAGVLTAAGVPVLRGTETALRAVRHLMDHRDRLELAAVAPQQVNEAASAWYRRLATGLTLPEATALELVRDFGIPTVATETATTLAAAGAVADHIGYPVALKTAARGVMHKSDAGGVVLGIAGPEELAAAYHRLAALGTDVVVQAMAPGGVEIALGVHVDKQFGPVVVVGAGGTLVEVLADRVTALPPLDLSRAHRMLDRLRMRPLLDGVRGAPACDRDAVAAAIVALAGLAAHLGDVIVSLDVNPLVAHPGGCLAVDAVVLTADVAASPSVVREVVR